MRLTKSVMFAIEVSQAVLRHVPEAIDLGRAWEMLDIDKLGNNLIVLDFRIRGQRGLFTAVCHLFDDPYEESRVDCKIEFLRFYWDYYGYLEAGELRLLNNRGGLDQLDLSGEITNLLAAADITQLGQLRATQERDLCWRLCPGSLDKGFTRSTQKVDNLTWAHLGDVRIALGKVGLNLPGPRLSYVEMQQLL